jgi:hypothetical protein
MHLAAEQWARVRTLLGEALELDAPAQLRFLDVIEDPVLRAGLARLDRALAEDEQFLARDRDFAQARSLLSRHYLWAPDGWLAAKRPARARTRYSQAIELATATTQQHPDDANARLILATAEMGVARAFAAESDRDGVARHRELAAAAARTVLAAHPDHQKARALLAQALGGQLRLAVQPLEPIRFPSGFTA